MERYNKFFKENRDTMYLDKNQIRKAYSKMGIYTSSTDSLRKPKFADIDNKVEYNKKENTYTVFVGGEENWFELEIRDSDLDDEMYNKIFESKKPKHTFDSLSIAKESLSPHGDKHCYKYKCSCGNAITCRCITPKTEVHVKSCYKCGEQKLTERKLKFKGVCDRVRKTQEGEEFWQKMMINRKEISEKEFLRNVDISAILDEDETWEEYKSGQSDAIGYYKSGNVYFFQTAGFEFIWE